MPIDDPSEKATNSLNLVNGNVDNNADVSYALSRLKEEADQAMSISFRRKVRDITKEFTIASEKVKPGELVKDDDFTLFEAVGALEIMDQKMDSGYVPPDDTFEPNFDPATGLEADQIVWIMDQLLCLEITWLEGYPLSQTIFTSLHIDRLLSPDSRHYDSFHHTSRQRPQSSLQDELTHELLRAYCIALIKCCQLASHLIQSQTYYEEEDFVTHLFGRELLPQVGSNQAVEMLNTTISELESYDLADDLSQALKARCSFRLDLLQTLAGDARRWDDILTKLGSIRQDHHKGRAIPEAFSDKVQRRLATSTPPRPMIEISFEAAYTKWASVCNDMLAVYRLTTAEIAQNPHCLQRAAWAFAYRTQPGALARAQIQDILFSDNAVGGIVPHFDLVLTDMKNVVLAGDSLSDTDNFQVEVPTDSRHTRSTLLQGFMEKVLDEYLNLYRMICQNRCRIRRTFTQAIAIWDAIQKEADAVDGELLRHSDSARASDHSKQFRPLLSWTAYHTLRVLAWTVQLGFETDIFLPDELSRMYWYLSAFCAYRSNELNTMQRALAERRKFLSRDSRQVAECDTSKDFLLSQIDYTQATRLLSDALWKFYYLLTKQNIIKPPKRTFAQADLLWEARMKSYLSVSHGYVEEDVPGPDSYEEEIEELEGTAFRSFESTCGDVNNDIKEAKIFLARLKKYTPEQAKYVGTEEEWKAEIKKMETTAVAVAVSVSQLKRLRDKYKGKRHLGEVIECSSEKKYHEWWVIPVLKEKVQK